jgi:DNA-binding transcriptional regulator YiaG
MKRGVTMSRPGIDFFKVKDDLMKDQEFKEEYGKLKPRYELISEIIRIRREQNITQEELALRIGTQNSNTK